MTRPLDPADVEALRSLLAGAAGLALDANRAAALAGSLRARAAVLAAGSVAGYLERAAADPGERQALVEAAVVGETHFYRTAPQIEALRRQVLPSLVARAGRTTRRLRLWSAGCSTGEEAYTLALLVTEALPAAERSAWDIRILGTDVSHRAVAAAREGWYAPRALELVDRATLERFFLPDGNGWRVGDELRALVDFRQHNLVTEPPPFGPTDRADLVLCRNVAIYFSRETTQALVARMHEALGPDGYLVLGHSETLWQVTDDFEVVRHGDAFLYRPVDASRPPAGGDLPADRTPRLRPVAGVATPAPRAPRPVVVAGTAAGSGPGPVADALAAVRAALDSGDYALAVEEAAQACARHPFDAEAHYLHGLALADLGRDEEALVALRRATYADPEAGFAHFLLASLLRRRGEANAAARSYRVAARTLGSRPSHATARELDGRRVEELAELCRSLATDGDHRSGARRVAGGGA